MKENDRFQQWLPEKKILMPGSACFLPLALSKSCTLSVLAKQIFLILDVVVLQADAQKTVTYQIFLAGFFCRARMPADLLAFAGE